EDVAVLDFLLELFFGEPAHRGTPVFERSFESAHRNPARGPASSRARRRGRRGVGGPGPRGSEAAEAGSAANPGHGGAPLPWRSRGGSRRCGGWVRSG